MSVSNKLVFEKMIKEIELAKQNKNSVREHIVKVKLLCELVIDSKENEEMVEKLMTEEVKEHETITIEKEIETDDPFSIFEF